MEVILGNFDVNEATRLGLSLLLIVAVYYRFNRVFSLRNLDLALLLCISPGLLLAVAIPNAGYVWLLALTLLLLLRLLCDGWFQRRPRTEQNLNLAGMGFLVVATFGFLTAEVITEKLPDSTVQTVRDAGKLLEGEGTSAAKEPSVSPAEAKQPGPAGRLLATPIAAAAGVGNGTQVSESGVVVEVASRVLAILCHLAVVAGLLYFGYARLGELQLGVAMAGLYLLLPCTAFEVGEVVHVLPAALILWALAFYDRPMVAGSLMGLACGTLGFPVFLLPLWMAFYGWRGALRFGLALGIVGAVLLASLAWTSPDTRSFVQQAIGVFDWSILNFQDVQASGFWAYFDNAYRIPMFAAFVIMLILLSVWPRQKNLEHLMANSTAVVVATQFLYPEPGGVYLLWYLPLLLTVVFRPRLAHLLPPEFPRKLKQQQQQPAPRARRELALSGHDSRHLFR
jgi:hypothetical protein